MKWELAVSLCFFIGFVFSDDVKSNSNITTNITNFQMKTSNSDTLFKTLIEEAGNTKTDEKKASRKITPTSSKDAVAPISNEYNSIATAQISEIVKIKNATSESKQTNEKFVSEEVVSNQIATKATNQPSLKIEPLPVDTTNVANSTVTGRNITFNIIAATTQIASPTTITTTTPKPKKPTITIGVEDVPVFKKNLPISVDVLKPHKVASTSNFPTPPEPPNAEPSREGSTNVDNVESNYSGRDSYMVPIVAIILIIPLTIGVVTTCYRRFRDFWSTRHYRRMDFLVDGMYND